MQNIENAIKETLDEARKIRKQIQYIESDKCGGGHYLSALDLLDLDKTVRQMALSKLKTKLSEVEENIVKMAKSIGVEETDKD